MLPGQILESLDHAVIAIDERGRISGMNSAAEILTRASRATLVGKPFTNLFKANMELASLVTQVSSTGQSIHAEDSTLYFWGRPPLPASISIAPIASEVEGGVVIAIKDRSRLESIEAEAKRSERLHMVSTIASGIAHEIKNPLAGIKGAAQLLEKKLDGKFKDHTKIIVREVERIKDMVEELLDLSRTKKTPKKSINIHKTLKEVISLESFASGNLKILEQFDPSLPEIEADEKALAQAFLNILVNGAEAMPDGGTIIVKTGRELESQHLKGASTKMAFISFEDEGPGIPDENVDTIFTPFFTSKPAGTGLGLAIALRIIKDHNGTIRVGNKDNGRGAKFTILLPPA